MGRALGTVIKIYWLQNIITRCIIHMLYLLWIVDSVYVDIENHRLVTIFNLVQ